MEEKIFPLIDSHAHLDLSQFESDLPDVISRAKSVGVERIGNVFMGHRAYQEKWTGFEDYPMVFFVLGVHPHDARHTDEDELQAISTAFAQDPRLRAWGEVGLDYFRGHSGKEEQQKCFKNQLQLAKERDIPVVIHCREAEEDLLQILDDLGYRDRPLLWHCFTQGTGLVKEILGRGWKVSIPGVVSFANANKLRAALGSIPLQSMLLETDCPFLAPVPFRGKRNEPAYILETARAVAQLTKQSLHEVCRQTTNNAVAFFGL